MKIAKCTFFFVYLWSAFFTSNFSFSQNIIDNCFQSSNPSIQFGSTANMFNTTSSDLLQWTGTTWIGGWPAAALTIPPPTNLIGCRAVFIGSGSAWTTGGEAFALRLDAPLIAGSSYSFDFTYVSHGLGSDGAFSPKIYTNSFGPLSGAYDTGNLQPVGYNWETHTFSFIANAAQAGHTWIIINTTSVGSSGLINSFCQNCNATTQICGVSVNNQSICEGSMANITATPTITGTYNYAWTVPTGFTNPGNVSNFSTNVAGNYSVVITDIVSGCVSLSASGTVTINATPIVSVNSQSICQGVTANITATPTVSGTNNYVWTVPTGFTNPGNVSNFSTNVAGNYSVVITDIVTGCVSLSASGVMDYYPDFDYTINKGCLNNKYILEISALNSTFDVSTVTYNWQNQDLISIGNDVSLDVTSYLNSTSIIEQLPLTITANVTNLNGCQKSSKIIIDQIYCEIQRGISPNNDNLNDFFDLTLLNVRQLKIFNRYGTMVYSHYDYKNEWYGQSDNGSELVDGVYYYLIDFNTPVESKTGWIYINK